MTVKQNYKCDDLVDRKSQAIHTIGVRREFLFHVSEFSNCQYQRVLLVMKYKNILKSVDINLSP